MSNPSVVNHTGVAVVTGCPASPFGSDGPFDTSFYASYAARKSSQIDVVGATDMAPLVLALENVVKVKVLLLRVIGATVKVKLTSAKGTLQALPLSSGGIMLFHQPTVGDEFTAIQFVGDGATVSYLIAGDLS